jgi:formylglycine-generating enzyme required for sulfatase activity
VDEELAAIAEEVADIITGKFSTIAGRPKVRFEPETIHIPAGEFLMGSRDELDVPSYEKPQTEILLPAYSIGKYQVTNEQYAEFTQQTKHKVRAEMGWQGLKPPEDRLKHPVVGISWYDALAYCQWLTKQTERPGEYNLPSEAEWEKAARGADGRIYPWGNEWISKNCNHSHNFTTPVTAPPDWINPYFPEGVSPGGCFDMVGNVREWTRTLWGKRLIAPDTPYPRASDDQDYRTAPDSIYRSHRGGAFDDELNQLRCSARGAYNPRQADRRLGFRVVLID